MAILVLVVIQLILAIPFVAFLVRQNTKEINALRRKTDQMKQQGTAVTRASGGAQGVLSSEQPHETPANDSKNETSVEVPEDTEKPESEKGLLSGM